MNPMAIGLFFEATCTSIFKRFFATRSTESSLLRPVLTYFSIIETNSQGTLHSYYFV